MISKLGPSPRRGLTLLLLSSLSLGCSDFPNEPPLTGVTIVPAGTLPARMVLGEIANVTVDLVDPEGRVLTGVDVTWRSSDETRLKVSRLAVPSPATASDSLSSQRTTTVTAHLPGTAEVIVSAQGSGVAPVEATFRIEVERGDWPESATVTQEDSVRLTLTNATLLGSVDWLSTNPAVLRVTPVPDDPTRAVTSARSSGTTEIVATVTGPASERQAFRIPVFVGSLDLAKAGEWPDTLRTTASAAFSVALSDSAFMGRLSNLVWHSTNAGVVEVSSQDGLTADIVARDLGSAELVVTFDRPGFQKSELRHQVTVLKGWLEVSAGGWPTLSGSVDGRGHSCAIDTEGEIYCWGAGNRGQLGIGTKGQFVIADVPTRVPTFLRFRSVSAGGIHTCALSGPPRSAGAGLVYCWGANDRQALGDGSPGGGPQHDRLIPVQSQGGAPFLEVSAGGDYTCALDEPDILGEFPQRVLCWGTVRDDDFNNFLGLGSFEFPPPGTGPVPLTVSAGSRHVCLVADPSPETPLSAPGGVYCGLWNYARQLGTGTGAPVKGADTTFAVSALSISSPFNPTYGPGFVFPSGKLSAGGAHTCYVDTGSVTRCWGANDFGQLGVPIGSAGEVCDPRLDAPNPGLGFDGESIAPWLLHASGLIDCSSTPRPIPGAPRFEEVTTGWGFTCGLTADGEAFCWGKNDEGQLGIGDRGVPTGCADPFIGGCQPVHHPTPVAGDLRFTSIDAGFEHVCGITSDLALYCWGGNGNGQVGNPGALRTSTFIPTLVAEPR